MKLSQLVALLGLAGILASGCGESGAGDDSAKRNAGRAAAGSEAAPAAEPEPPKEKPMPKVPQAEISGALVAPLIWSTPAEVKAHCGKAIDEARALRDQVVGVAEARDLANTLAPTNDIFLKIDAVLPLSELIANVHPDKAVRDAAEKCQQDAMKFISDLQLDRGMYDALVALQADGLEETAARSLTHLLRDYRRSGVDKDEATRKKLADLNEQMVKTGQTFARRIREDKRSIEVAPEDLAGMPEDFVKAHPVKNGKVKLTTDYPDFFPVQSYAAKEDVRKALYVKFLERAYPENAETLKKLLELRHEYATTLGYPNWAEYNAEDKMAKDQKTIGAFIDKVAGIARPRMQSDLKEILARKQQDDAAAADVRMWDRFFYVKKIQSEKFGVDSQEVRQYFDYPKVRDGILGVNQELFGVTFKQVADAPVWHESVLAYDVFDGDAQIGRFYLDMHPREGKYGHAAMFNVLSGITGRQLPTAALVCNFPQPSDQGPALMEHGDVTTFFHEFGHLMHHLLGSGYRWANLSGIACEWDFVEAPSQLLEEWAWSPEVLARFAHHHATGEPIPAELVKKMRAADEFGKGVHVMRQMFYAGLSFAYHNQDPRSLDLLAELKAVQQKYNPYPYEEGTWVYANFGHLEGYSSMYYTYMWSLVLAKDLFTRFADKGLFDKEVSADYRKYVIGAGGAVDATQMVENFLGRATEFDAFRDYLEQS